MAVRSDKKNNRQRDKANLIAQEIAFAKVLAGNDKKLRDRAVKKLKRWLLARAEGKCAFVEDDFIRIWTGLFYCMWMSDKPLIQEELAESLSQLIHCFDKSGDKAVTYIKCFFKTLLIEWQGLDQYRVDKFAMLVRRVMRQSLEYCRQKNWDKSVFGQLMKIMSETVLSNSSALGLTLHIFEIFLEEFAKVGKGKLDQYVITTAIEPFVKLVSNTRDPRIRLQFTQFFEYLLSQTDLGLEYEERFQEWKKLGYPGEGPHELTKLTEEKDDIENENEDKNNTDEVKSGHVEITNKPLDPRAGSVHVDLPQISFDVDELIGLLDKYIVAKESNVKGRKLLTNSITKLKSLKKGKFPRLFRKPAILDHGNWKSRHLNKRKAEKLLRFTKKISQKKNIRRLNKLLKQDEDLLIPNQGDEDSEKESKSKNKRKRKALQNESRKKVKTSRESGEGEKVDREKQPEGENTPPQKSLRKSEEKHTPVKEPKRKSLTGSFSVEPITDEIANSISSDTKKKRKVSGNWLIDEINENSPEYSSINTPKIIKIEKKVGVTVQPEAIVQTPTKNDPWKEELEEGEVEIFVPNKKYLAKKASPNKSPEFPVFFEKAKAKAVGKKRNSNLSLNLSLIENTEKSSRRISFALDRNMAQDNEEYLQEVKNSPKIPYDRSRKPIQSALKSGLSPSPINPFYNFIKTKK